VEQLMLYFKDNARLGDTARPQLILAIMLVDQVYDGVNQPECWITSINDSTHGPNSKHFTGEGVDIRTKNLTATQRTLVVGRLQSKLGPLGYDVILEDEGGNNEHLHIEWDPK
jgi:hypothetical protein